MILGIDPGLNKTGWGVVSNNGNEYKCIDYGVIKTSANDNMEHRLSIIFDSLQNIERDFSPDSVAMEKVFINVNAKSSEKLIMARTAAFLSLAKAGFYINEYSPNEIKKNITGSGHARKDIVHRMTQKILGINIDNYQKIPDSMDALATSLCHAFNHGIATHIRKNA